MEFAVGAVIVVVLFFVLMYLRSRSIAKRHAATLSQITGIPADQILREMINRNQTPGEWAERHGLDRWTFATRTDLTTTITATVAREYPSEKIIAVSRGAVEFGGTLIAVAVTDQAVYLQNATESDRVEYPAIDTVEHLSPTKGGRIFIKGFPSEGISLHLVDADGVVAAIQGQLAKITVLTERVKLTQDGGALFRWRMGWNGEYMWIIQYDHR